MSVLTARLQVGQWVECQSLSKKEMLLIKVYIAGNGKDEPVLNYYEAHVFSMVKSENAQRLFLCCVRRERINSDPRRGGKKTKKTPSRPSNVRVCVGTIGNNSLLRQ